MKISAKIGTNVRFVIFLDIIYVFSPTKRVNMPNRDKVRQMFDDIASDYDALNHIMSLNVDRSWRRRALKRIITPDRAQNIMDLACGTGDFSIAIAEAMPEGSHVTGVDLSEGMLAVMRRKVDEAGLSDRISIQTGEGENLAFPDDTFDVVTIAFGIRNFENREQGLREALRVLKPGGSIVILELSEPGNPVVRWFYDIYFTRVLPLIGKKVSGNGAAYHYLPASVINFPKKEEWMETMRECGFGEVAHRAFSLGICRMYSGRK